MRAGQTVFELLQECAKGTLLPRRDQVVEVKVRRLLPSVAENFLSRLVHRSQFAVLIVCENNVVRVFEQFAVMFRQGRFTPANRLRLPPNIAADKAGPENSDRHARDHQKQSPKQLVELRRDRRFRRTALCQGKQRTQHHQRPDTEVRTQTRPGGKSCLGRPDRRCSMCGLMRPAAARVGHHKRFASSA